MERFSLELSAQIQPMEAPAASPVLSRTTDISACGGYFVTDIPLPVGTEVLVDLFIPLKTLKKGKKKTRVQICGMVVRAAADGVAISFDEKYQVFPLQDREN